MGTHPIFESDFDCLTEMSQGAPDLDCGAYVDEMNIQQGAGFLFDNIPDISSRPAGRIQPNRRNETNLKEEADKVLPNEFVELVDTRLTDGSFEAINLNYITQHTSLSINLNRTSQLYKENL